MFSQGTFIHRTCRSDLELPLEPLTRESPHTGPRQNLDRAHKGMDAIRVVLTREVALRHIRMAGAMCAACLALECGSTLETARAVLEDMMNEAGVLLTVEQCRYCQRTIAVARYLGAPPGN